MVLCASLTGRSELKLAAFAFASFVALASCQDRAPPPPQKTPAMTGPVNIGAVIRQVHFAWREKGGEWTSGHTTYESRFAQDGLAFTPFHRPAERAQALAGAPVRFALPLLKRGDHPLGTPGLHAGNSASGGVHVQRGAFVEEYENSEDGVEQRWRFEAGPPGEGRSTSYGGPCVAV